MIRYISNELIYNSFRTSIYIIHIILLFLTLLLFPCCAVGKSFICSGTAVACKILGMQVSISYHMILKISYFELFSIKIIRSNLTFKSYADKVGAKFKNSPSNSGNAFWYGYAGKAGTTLKSQTFNAGNAIRYGYAGKAGTIGKSH